MKSPAMNRVTPLGGIVAAPGRGAWMGNRGVLHSGPESRSTRQIVRTSRNLAWITCALSFRDRRVPQWEPDRYTPLFFLDEAVALAAGHRPCAECRRADYTTYRAAWTEGWPEGPPPYARDIDQQLNAERRQQLLHRTAWADLPDGAFVLLRQGPAVLVGDRLTLWQPDNTYSGRLPRPRHGTADVVTPPSSLRVLRAGYPVQIDPAAR